MFPLAFGIQPGWDILIIAGVVVLLFGGSKLPIWSKSIGQSIKEFKKATHEDEEAVPPAAAPAPPPTVVVTKTEEK